MIFNEIFYSIQGEGLNIGMPSIFVRFGNCNLQCTWCDTKYTWHPDTRNNKAIPIEAIIEKIHVLSEQYACRRLVITGGEPMLQQDEIIALRKAFPDFYIEVETNGSQTMHCNEAVDLFTVSYKTSNSGNKRYQLKALGEKCVYKFVVDTPSDFIEIDTLIQEYDLPKKKIFLMPQGISKEEIELRAPWIVEHCMSKGYRFTTRLHVVLWGARPGV